MEILELSELSEGGAFFEEVFDRKFREFDWSRFDDQPVRVSNCGLTNVPGWVYLSVGIELGKRASKVFFGDSGQPKRIFKRDAAKPQAEHES